MTCSMERRQSDDFRAQGRDGGDRLTAKEQLRLQRLFEAYPSLRPLYEKMQALRALMNRKHLKRRECWQPARQLLAFIQELKTAPSPL